LLPLRFPARLVRTNGLLKFQVKEAPPEMIEVIIDGLLNAMEEEFGSAVALGCPSR